MPGALLALLLAAGLSAAHWLPGMELTRQSTRAGALNYETATLFTWPPANLLTFVAPYAYGNPAAGGNQGWRKTGHFWDNGYLGLIPLALALFAAVACFGRERHARFFALLAVLSVVVALGPHTPLFRALWHAVPGMSLFRFPSRFIVLADLALATLAAFGLDRLMGRSAVPPRPPAPSPTRGEGEPDAVGPPHPPAPSLTRGEGESGAVGPPHPPTPSPTRGEGGSGVVGPPHPPTPSPTRGEGETLGDGLPSPRSVGEGLGVRGLPWAAVLAVALTLLDLGIFAGRFQRFTDARAWLAPPSTARFLHSDEAHSPLTTHHSPLTPYYALGYLRLPVAEGARGRGWMGDLAPFHQASEMLAPNSSVLYGLPCFNAFLGLETNRAVTLYGRLAEDRCDRRQVVTVPRRLSNVLALLGVSHVVTTFPLPADAFQMRLAHTVSPGEGEPDVRVFALEGVRPRLWIPRKVAHAQSGSEALERVMREDRAVVEAPAGEAGGSEGEVASLEAGDGWARARVTLAQPGYVVHDQRWYPGWRAWVDGRLAPVRRANYLMQAAPVPAGEHQVEFRYQPDSYRVGLLLSLGTLVLLLGAGGGYGWISRRALLP